MNTRADDSRAEGVCEGRVKPRQDAAAVQVAGGGGLKRKKIRDNGIRDVATDFKITTEE